jgi:hypothetical protein
MAEPRSLQQWLPDLIFGFENLASHKLRSLLTMLGMIFGVAAVVAMLSIGAGAQQKVMAFIEQLGVRNLIVEAKEAHNWQELQKVRKNSPGLTLNDYQVIRKNMPDIQDGTPRKRFVPGKLLPKPQQDLPIVYGVEPSYLLIGHRQSVWRCSRDRRIHQTQRAVVPCNRNRCATACPADRGFRRPHRGHEQPRLRAIECGPLPSRRLAKLFKG